MFSHSGIVNRDSTEQKRDRFNIASSNIDSVGIFSRKIHLAGKNQIKQILVW